METNSNTLIIEIPEGMEIDTENSSLAEGIVKFKKHDITYNDILQACPTNFSGLRVRTHCMDKILAISQLMNIAKYFNGDWEYSANIIVQCFGKEDEDDKHIVHPLNFMPRKERCCELDYDLSDKGQKEKYLKQLRDSQERLKILSLLLHKQEEEVVEFGYPKTTCYYPDLNCLKEIDFKEDKQ
nr:MAG: hypothetical protein [Bacteriophage sp.]